MEIVIHSVNTLDQLSKVSTEFGCEIDIRSNGGHLILNHDPHEDGEKLVDFLENYQHGLLVLNVKEAGLENEIIQMMSQAGITEYFLLDVEFPYLYRAAQMGIRNIAVRFSEEEPIQMAQNFIDRVDWIWIDTLTKLPISADSLPVVQKFKSCLVCPERWGRPMEIPQLKKQMLGMDFHPSAVMTGLNFVKEWLSE
ncbi:MAG: hypothetical protein ACKO1T_08300 [Sediminibacterium sp.]